MGRVIISEKGDTRLAEKVPAFPTISFETDFFVWEEACFENNYRTVFFSGMGRRQAKNRAYQHLTSRKVHKQHTFAFEVEINGQILRDYWIYEGTHQETDEKGFIRVVTRLFDEVTKIRVYVHTLIDNSSFLTRWLEIENTSDKMQAVTSVSPFAGIISRMREDGMQSYPENSRHNKYMLGHFRDNFTQSEGEFEWLELPTPNSGLVYDTFRSKYNFPMYIVRNANTGENFIINLETTINPHFVFNHWGDPKCLSYGLSLEDYVQCKVGLSKEAVFRWLEPGQKVISPSVHFSCVYGDLDICVNSLYKHLRTSVLPEQPLGREHLVEYNHAGYTAFRPVSKQQLMDEIDICAELGAELFTIDDGWYGSVDQGWWKAIGDWYENSLINGELSEVLDYARSKGIKVGLWLPIEEVGLESEAIKRHPDWFQYKDEKGGAVWDITNPEVEKFMYDTLVRLIDKYKLDCFRLDGGCTCSGQRVRNGQLENNMWEYIDKLYAFYEKISAKYPHMLMENCSGGGGRNDLGMLRRFHYTQVSDNWNCAQQLRVFNGTTLAIPPERCLVYVGFMTPFEADIRFAVRSGMFGHITIAGAMPDLASGDNEALREWKRCIQLYKDEIRPVFMSGCEMYHHTPIHDYSNNGDWVVMEICNPEHTRNIIGLFRLQDSKESEFTVIPKGLNIQKTYEITFDNSGESIRLTGWEIKQKGIRITIPGVLMSELLLIKEV
ncbi:MAG TPA: alpha-galactosidase [Clostridiales bacterium]|jgi:alpha-galactosidase|nr:alpha-galactosidase [Clostridiales bacterium]